MISLRRDKWPQTPTFPLQYSSSNLAITTVIRIPFTMTAHLDLETYFSNPSGKLTEVRFSFHPQFLICQCSWLLLCVSALFPWACLWNLASNLVLKLWSNSHLVLLTTKIFILKRDELVEVLDCSVTCHLSCFKSNINLDHCISGKWHCIKPLCIFKFISSWVWLHATPTASHCASEILREYYFRQIIFFW